MSAAALMGLLSTIELDDTFAGAKKEEDCWTALHYAAESGHAAVCALLLGGNIDFGRDLGATRACGLASRPLPAMRACVHVSVQACEAPAS